MDSAGMPISDEGWDLLQSLARDSESARAELNGGWSPHTPDHKPLVWLKLIEERERRSGGIELRLTDFGWKMLAEGLERV